MFTSRLLQRAAPLLLVVPALAIVSPSPSFALSAPSSSSYKPVPVNKSFAANHAIYSNIMKPDSLKEYTIYSDPKARDLTSPMVVANVRFGTTLNGHKGKGIHPICTLLLGSCWRDHCGACRWRRLCAALHACSFLTVSCSPPYLVPHHILCSPPFFSLVRMTCWHDMLTCCVSQA